MQKRKRVPRPMRVPQIVSRAVRFAILDSIADQIERGEVTVAVVNGREFVAYYDMTDGNYHELEDAMLGWLDFMELLGERVDMSAKTEAHRKIITTLVADEDINLTDIDAMRAEIEQHKVIYLRSTPELRSSLAASCQIKFKLDDQQLAHKEAA